MTGKPVVTPNRVLAYHKIDTKREVGITVVHPEKFTNQVKYLVRKGYQFVTLSELFFNDKKNKIALTFDDAYQNVYDNAFPVLKELNIPATIFVICSAIGKYNLWEANLLGIKYKHMNEDEIKQLLDNGWEIGSHGIKHHSLKNADSRILDDEIGWSKEILTEKFQRKINFFSAPFGRINDIVLQKCRQFGYAGCCGFYPLKYLKQKPANIILPRLGVYMGENETDVARKVSDDYKKLKYEVMKQNFINFWNRGTIIVQELK